LNWVDFFIAVVVVIAVAIGYKKGLFKSIATFLGLIVANIISINYADWLAITIEGIFNLSPSIRYVFCYLVIFILCLLLFRVLGHYFYKMVRLTPLKYPDYLGGSIFGMLKGIVILSMIFIMFIFFPAFNTFNDQIDNSVMAPYIRQVVPISFESTSAIHPNSGPFMSKISRGVLGSEAEQYGENPEELLGQNKVLGLSNDDIRVLNNIDRYFGSKVELAKKGDKE
jgi:membrane protein required for colicin V production